MILLAFIWIAVLGGVLSDRRAGGWIVGVFILTAVCSEASLVKAQLEQLAALLICAGALWYCRWEWWEARKSARAGEPGLETPEDQ